jgi:hypothetical protein
MILYHLILVRKRSAIGLHTSEKFTNSSTNSRQTYDYGTFPALSQILKTTQYGFSTD